MPTINDPSIWLKELFMQAGLTIGLSSFLSTMALVVIVIFLSWLSNVIAKAIIRKVVSRIVAHTESQWDDIFLEQKVFTRLSHLAPALVIWAMAGWALKAYPVWLALVQRLTYVYMVFAATIVMTAFVEAWHQIYRTLPISQHRHIKGYVQLVKIFIILISILIVISVVFKKDISTLVAGIGAMAAVLILVFKDTLLGLVASIQLSANDMLRIGDWITIPGRDVDGVVLDITLNTVKIQNFDKTIITVPTYALVNESFQNWKGMEMARSRQIKRPLFIDMKTIRFVDPELRERLSRIPALKEYIETLEKSVSNDSYFGTTRITNLGLFRVYAETYLKKHPLVDTSEAAILRHRQSDGNGLPLQVYVFSKGYQLLPYENFQSEIFEHLIAVMPEFDLKVFQHPTGYDVLASQRN